MDDDYWFLPKSHGYGAGFPVRWQGWALLGAYAVLISAASLLVVYTFIGFICALVVLTVPFLMITARKTRGGWGWRWGEKD